MTRILLLDSSDRGGIATYRKVWRESALAAGFDVLDATPEAQADLRLASHAWLPGRRIRDRPKFYVGRLREVGTALGVALRSRRVVDIAHFQTSIAPRFDVQLARLYQRAGVRVVVTLHDVLDHDTGAPHRLVPLAAVADKVLVHSVSAQDELAKHGVRATVVYVDLAFGLNQSRIPQAAARSTVGIIDGSKVILLFGLLRPYKGLPFLLDVWNILTAAMDNTYDLTLLLVGQSNGDVGPILTRLVSAGAELREGFVDEGDVDTWLAAADVVVLPYTRGSHSGVLQRAVGLGVPVLASPALEEEANRFGATVLPLEPEIWAQWLSQVIDSPLPAGKAGRPAAVTNRHAIDRSYKDLVR